MLSLPQIRRHMPSFARSRPREAARLVLEVLEDRCVLSVPALSYSSYLPNTAYAIAVDGAGEAFLAGGSYGGGVAYVARMNATGTALAYLTNLGSSGINCATGIAIDSSGDAYVTGYTTSTSFPTTANAAFQAGAAFTNSGTAGFLTELSPTGSILYSTYLPAVQGYALVSQGPAVAVGPSGTVYVSGAAGAGLPVTAGAYQSTYTGAGTGNGNAFLAVLNPSLSGTAGLVYASYLGGTTSDTGTGIAVDASGNACITGYTFSTNFPTTPGVFQASFGTKTGGGREDAFVAKMNPSLSGQASLLWSSFLGGSGTDGWISDNHAVIMTGQTGPAIAVDGAGNLYVTGSTSSANFPTTPGAFQTKLGNPAGSGVTTIDSDAYVTKINPAGTALIYSTFLGGNNLDGGAGVAVDGSGNAYVTGWTRSTNFPTVNPIQAQKNGGKDRWGNPNSNVFVATLNASGSALLFSTYFGGSGDDYGFGIGLDAAGDALAAGQATSTNFPTTAGAYQRTAGGGFVFDIDPPAGGHPASTPVLNATAVPFDIPPTSAQVPVRGTDVSNRPLPTTLQEAVLILTAAEQQAEQSLSASLAAVGLAVPADVLDGFFADLAPASLLGSRFA